MTADENYFLSKSENLVQPIQMELSKNLKTFSQHFAQFLESTLNLKHFERKHDPRSLCIFQINDCEGVVRQMFKFPRFIQPFYGQHPSKGRKHL